MHVRALILSFLVLSSAQIVPAQPCGGLESQTQNAVFDGNWNDMGGVPVEIIGVGFFDCVHSQTGRSPNNIEIHPVLSINFNPGLPAQVQRPSRAPRHSRPDRTGNTS
jgi:hypothetical protein